MTATRRWYRLGAAVALVAVGLVATAGARSPALAAGSTSCPSNGSGGPFLRVCSAPGAFAGSTRGIGASVLVTPPCTTSDFVERTYTTGGGTTDEGYAYLAFYAPGDELEVGLMHNVRLGFNGYSLYVRHGHANQSFWNIDPSRAVACGKTVEVSVLLSVAKPGQVGIEVVYHVEGQAKGYIFVFERHAGDSQERPNMVPVNQTSTPAGRAVYPAGKGSITPLAPANWSRGCATCAVAMITAVAQNGPGAEPVLPLQDGATFGPVGWGAAYLLVDGAPRAWTPARTGATVLWKKGLATETHRGGPPSYTVSDVTVPCSAPKSSDVDQWSCSTIRHASP
jgi:hypothetical protein